MNQQCACQWYFIIIIIIIFCFMLTLKPGIRRLERREEVAQGAGVSRALAVNRGGAEILWCFQQRRSCWWDFDNLNRLFRLSEWLIGAVKKKTIGEVVNWEVGKWQWKVKAVSFLRKVLNQWKQKIEHIYGRKRKVQAVSRLWCICS